MSKKVIIIGATGTIGKAIVNEMNRDCEVIPVGGSSGDHTVDIASNKSITELYEKFSDADAVICAAARGVVFAPLSEIIMDDLHQSMQSKQLGQIDLVLQGLKQLKPNASFTLTTGLLNHDPIVAGAAAAMVNSAVEGFCKAAAIDVPGKQRINVVSPNLLLESVEKYRDFFHGFKPVPAAEVALAYRKSVMGNQTGQIYQVGW